MPSPGFFARPSNVDPTALPVSTPPDQTPSGSQPRKSILHRLLWIPGLTILLLITGFIGRQALTLFNEVLALRDQQARLQNSRVIGFEGINPQLSFARRPNPWFREEDGICWLWSGWIPQKGHGWFRVEKDAFNPNHLSGFLGRDVIRAIDTPILETAGGERWNRIPENYAIYCLQTVSSPTAYPRLVLDKVGIVNESVDPIPQLIVYTAMASPETAVKAYDPRLSDGRRVTMGSTGYFLNERPLLYDRDTESLWIARSGGLASLCGPLRGTLLTESSPVELTTWSDWKGANPSGRVVVGARRPSPPARAHASIRKVSQTKD